MPISLLSTKLHTPQARANAVPRPRLVSMLLDGFHGFHQRGSFALISAPAGFGKTTLLSAFAAELHQPVAWLALDEADNDPLRFWSYLIAACQGVQPRLGEAALALLQSPQELPDETIPTVLINELAKLDAKMALILDDYQVIQNPSIHAGLLFLLKHIPATLYVVVSTRMDPPWPLAQFRVRDQLAEVRAFDLRFTRDEAGAFLNQVMDLKLSAPDVAALEARTEGWIASLQLAAISMKGRSDTSGFIQAFTVSQAYVADYLVEEVLERQPEAVRDFLLRTSILDSMNGALCETVSGQPEGAQRLREIDKANLFVVALDDKGEWYRYHQLFSDLLRARLQQSLPAPAVAALHQAAMAWYQQAGMIPDAIRHALAAQDYERAAGLVEQVALPMIMQGHVRTVDGWLRAMPSQYTVDRPKLNMAFAWLHLLRSSLAGAQPYLDRLNRSFAVREASQGDDALLGEWLAIESKVYGMQGQPLESREYAERALRLLPESEVHVRSMLHMNLATACEQLADYDGAARIFQMIVQRAELTGDSVTEILGAAGEARMLMQQGKLHDAFDIAQRAVARLEASGRFSPFSATLYGELGQIYYFWHELDKAREYVGKSIEASGFSGYSDPEIHMHLMVSRIFQMKGDTDGAALEMEQAADMARSSPPAMVQEQVTSQQVRVDLALDRLPAAEAVLQPEGFAFAPCFAFPPVPSTTKMSLPLALLYNSALRVVLHRERNTADLQRAVDMAATLLDEEMQHSYVPGALETLLLRSQLLSALGDAEGSLADVKRAVDLAEPGDFVSPFVEEGAPIMQALESLRDPQAPRASFVERVLECFQAAPPVEEQTQSPQAADPMRALIEPLTARELEVLALIADGCSNQAIAHQLVITLSAVKKHAGNIFRKMNVSSRTQALARGRDLGLLPRHW